MLKNANRSFLGALCRQGLFAGSLLGVMCSLLLLASSVASAQVQEQRDNRRERTRPAPRISDQDRAREFDRITTQPPNSIQVQVRYKKEYGYKYDSGVFNGSGPTSCDAFFISAGLDPSVRLEHLYGIHKIDKIQESNGFYGCDFLVTDLPLNAPIKVGVDLADRRSLPFEAWKGGSQAQPPPGQQRTIIIVGGRTSRVSRVDAEIFAPQNRAQDGTVTLTQAQPRATLLFEMVYALPDGAEPIKTLGRVKLPPTTLNPPRPICDVAREARARNSPAAPGLEAQCRAAGEAGTVDVNALAAKGEAIANEDPLAAELRNQQPEGPVRRGFDIGMAAAEGQTLPGPGKQRIHDSLSPAEQEGFTTAVSFSLERNRNADFAARGAAIAKVDPIVAAARTAGRRRLDVLYGLGFDIATGIFGDPAQGALGNTATGPGSLKIRDSLSPAGQRGFNASVKLHLGQAPPSSAPEARPRASREVTSIDNPYKSDKVYVPPSGEVTSIDNPYKSDKVYVPPSGEPNSIRVQVRYRKEYGYKGDTSAFGHVGSTSCGAFSVSARPDPSVRLDYLIGIQNPTKMRESDGFYVCDFLVTDLPLNAPIKVGVDLVDRRSLPFEAWQGGSGAQPPPGQQRTIIIVGGRASRERRAQDGTVTLTEAQPRATQVFEMVYAPITPR